MQDVQEWNAGEGSLDFTLSAISQLPESLLRAELQRRNVNQAVDSDDTPSCGSRQRGAYNTPLHVMALFLILVLSTFACSFPVLARRFPRLPIPRRFLFISRHFGTGVLIATAFVHLLPTAFMSLTDPCLPRFWSQSYRAMAGFVAMVSVFAVVIVEMFFAMKGAGHVHGNDYDTLMGDIGRESLDDFRHEAPDYSQLDTRTASGDIRMEGLQQNGQLGSTDPARSHNTEGQHVGGSHLDKDEDADIEGLDVYADDIPINGQPRASTHSAHRHRPRLSEHYRSQAGSDMPIQNPQRQLLQCLLLEAGILFHSIFIGMALSVATGTSFVVLLIAISFHQTFEGFALGSRIASLIPDLFSPSSMKPWLMSLAYGTTTPLGQAIGLILHNMYDPASTTGLLMVGITNAISSGLLLFAGLVELLAEDFLSESSYETLRGRRRVEACVSVACGAILMALVGAFA
ncbi:Zinc/iron permease [Penicillium argentinense]|uniref:Zinc/iron permease n=1 Tax=Penicillium argentinense TaxID=1131581 RepID=A0A9W9FF74_9EURO|nr:Zinc/iron permease [Penicillium argentinense]KAJ5099110.1 Zinc/iron permease [Penicillium argentinense]